MNCLIMIFSLCACHSIMSADGSWSVCTHEHLHRSCSLFYALASAVMSQGFSVCTHEHLTHRCSLDSALATALVSADGSWSVCTHEHLPDRCLFLYALATVQIMSADGSWVFAHASDRSLFSLLCACYSAVMSADGSWSVCS
jgi:hypothetical protein